MAPFADTPDASNPLPPAGPIAERVAERLDRAGQAFDRRNGAIRPKRKTTGVSLASQNEADAFARRELACLRSVFSELGDAHRRYRNQTGRPGTPALRAAAEAFKLAPSTGSLLPVAVFIDDLEILAW